MFGINDGAFPTVNKFEGYLNDKDRNILSSCGMELAKTSMDNLYESNFEIYNILCLASDKLYLSYYSSDKEGKVVRPSILIKKIKKIFPKLVEKSDIITKEYFITNKIATFDDSIVMYKKILDGENVLDEWKTVLNYYSKTEKEKYERIMEGLIFTNKAENISEENIKKLYGKKLMTSISRLEEYRKCPFSFHLKYGLQLKEKEELQMQTLQTGSFMHEIIDTFFEVLEEKELNIRNLDEELLKKLWKK